MNSNLIYGSEPKVIRVHNKGTQILDRYELLVSRRMALTARKQGRYPLNKGWMTWYRYREKKFKVWKAFFYVVGVRGAKGFQTYIRLLSSQEAGSVTYTVLHTEGQQVLDTC